MLKDGTFSHGVTELGGVVLRCVERRLLLVLLALELVVSHMILFIIVDIFFLHKVHTFARHFNLIFHST